MNITVHFQDMRERSVLYIKERPNHWTRRAMSKRPWSLISHLNNRGVDRVSIMKELHFRDIRCLTWLLGMNN